MIFDLYLIDDSLNLDSRTTTSTRAAADPNSTASTSFLNPHIKIKYGTTGTSSGVVIVYSESTYTTALDPLADSKLKHAVAKRRLQLLISRAFIPARSAPEPASENDRCPVETRTFHIRDPPSRGGLSTFNLFWKGTSMRNEQEYVAEQIRIVLEDKTLIEALASNGDVAKELEARFDRQMSFGEGLKMLLLYLCELNAKIRKLTDALDGARKRSAEHFDELSNSRRDVERLQWILEAFTPTDVGREHGRALMAATLLVATGEENSEMVPVSGPDRGRKIIDLAREMIELTKK